MVVLYQVCSNCDPGLKAGPALGVTSYLETYIKKISFFETTMPRPVASYDDSLPSLFKACHTPFDLLSYFWRYSNEIWTICTVLKTNINAVLGWPWLWPFDLLSYFWSYSNAIWTMCTVLKTNISILCLDDLLSYFWSYCNDIWTIKLLIVQSQKSHI